MTVLAFMLAVAPAAGPTVLIATESPEFASMALLSAVLAGLSVALRRHTPTVARGHRSRYDA